MDCYRISYNDFISLVDSLNLIGKRTYGYRTPVTEDWTAVMLLEFQYTDGHRVFVLDADVCGFSNDAIRLIAKSIRERFSDK